jgi:hypothetical protein
MALVLERSPWLELSEPPRIESRRGDLELTQSFSSNRLLSGYRLVQRNSSLAAAVSWTFPIVAARSGAWPFAFFAAMMGLQLLFAWKLMPETKGGTLEDIETRLA